MNLELRYSEYISRWCVYLNEKNIFIAYSYREAHEYFLSLSGGGVEIRELSLDNQLVEMMKRWNYHWEATKLMSQDRQLFTVVKTELRLS